VVGQLVFWGVMADVLLYGRILARVNCVFSQVFYHLVYCTFAPALFNVSSVCVSYIWAGPVSDIWRNVVLDVWVGLSGVWEGVLMDSSAGTISGVSVGALWGTSTGRYVCIVSTCGSRVFEQWCFVCNGRCFLTFGQNLLLFRLFVVFRFSRG
jgi:hypothetical protein